MSATKRTDVHESIERVEEIDASSDRAFGVVFTVAFGVLAGYALYRESSHWMWLAAVAAAFGLATLVVPGLLAPLNRLWMRFALLLSKVMTPLVLTILFFGVVLPTGLFLRMFGGDSFRLRRSPDAASYWVTRDPPGPSPESLKQQF